MTRGRSRRRPRSFAQLVRSDRMLKACRTTLRAASRDEDNRQELSGLDVDAVNMDAVKTRWLNQCGCTDHVLKSSDALLAIGDTVYLIEFKAGSQKNVKAHDVREKAISSLLVLSDLTGWTCKQMRSHVEYMYVHPSRTRIGKHVRHKAKGDDGGNEENGIAEFLRLAEGSLFHRGHMLSGTDFDKFVNHASL